MPKPVLQAMALADHVYRDQLTGKCIIAGTFTRINRGSQKALPNDGGSEVQGEVRKFAAPPISMGSPYLYLALVEVHGEVVLELKFIDLSDASVVLQAKIGVTSSDPVALNEFILPMPDLPVVHRPASTYSLDLLHENETLGSWRVVVVDLPNKNPEENP